MKHITNRVAISVVPQVPFVEWVHSLDATAAQFSAQDICESPTIYLAYDSEDGDAPEKIIKKSYKRIFEEELNNWMIDESTWPKKRDLKAFRAWFHVYVHDIVLDLDDSPYLMEGA